jgi:hypothetical protein
MMDPETQAAWNAWLDSRVDARIDAAVGMIVDVLGEEAGREHRELRAQIKSLQALLADVHAALNAAQTRHDDTFEGDNIAAFRRN